MSLAAPGFCAVVFAAAVAAAAVPSRDALRLGTLRVRGRRGLRRQPEIKSEIEKEIASRLHDKELAGNASASAPHNLGAPRPRNVSAPVFTKGVAAEYSLTSNASSRALRRASTAAGSQRHAHLVPTVAPAPAALGPCSLLVFWAVSAEQRVMQLVSKDIEHLREALEDECRVDVFLAHYDLKKSAWTKKQGKEWYRKNVKYSAQQKGYKFQLMQSLFTAHNYLREYDWVWALDEDVDFARTDLRKMLSLAQESGALIALPAFTEMGRSKQDRELDYSLQSPDPRCQYRYTPMVEVIFPLFQATALQHILKDCTDCIHEKSTWGLDRVWCHYSARRMGHDIQTACAILDATPVIHRNYKTLKEKYKAGTHRQVGGYSDAFYNMARADFGDVKRNHPDDFVDGPASGIKASKCAKTRP